MQILIGGSPSTGSSLLRQMLNRHPDIYCGPETCLFAFPELIERWALSKKKLTGSSPPLRARLKSPALRLMKGVSLAGDEQGWEPTDVEGLVVQSQDFKAFAESYFARGCAKYNKKHWAEKTPENVLAFGSFRELWPEGHIIHIVRNPADTIVSLLSRGHTLFFAAARYLYHTAFGLRHRTASRYHEVHYDTLVTRPEHGLTSLLLGLGLHFDQSMLAPGNPNMAETDQMEGWTYSELEPPGTMSVGRFASEDETVQQQVAAALYSVRITDTFAATHGLTHQDIPSVARELGYTLPVPDQVQLINVRSRLIKEMQRYRWRRLRRFNWFFEKEKPLEIVPESQVRQTRT